MTVYMPDIEVDHVLELAGQRMDTSRLAKIDEHTLECAPGDVTFIPLPEGRIRNSPALLTIELPDGIKREQVFNGSVHQVSGFPRAILGAFQVRIPVSNKALCSSRRSASSVLRHIAKSIPLDDPWHAVFQRFSVRSPRASTAWWRLDQGCTVTRWHRPRRGAGTLQTSSDIVRCCWRSRCC
jgi:hypothetical protein